MRNDGLAEIKHDGVTCHLAIERPTRRIVVVRLAGWDAGEFGDMPMRELEKDLAEDGLIQLFVDARLVKAASIAVSSDWAQWLGKHRSHFEHISMLTGSRYIQITANFVRRFSDLGDLMRIYTEAQAFDTALVQAIEREKQ